MLRSKIFQGSHLSRMIVRCARLCGRWALPFFPIKDLTEPSQSNPVGKRYAAWALGAISQLCHLQTQCFDRDNEDARNEGAFCHSFASLWGRCSTQRGGGIPVEPAAQSSSIGMPRPRGGVKRFRSQLGSRLPLSRSAAAAPLPHPSYGPWQSAAEDCPGEDWPAPIRGTVRVLTSQASLFIVLFVTANSTMLNF